MLHEIEGHARPRAQSMLASSAHFRIGTARGIDDQEGRAVLLEERAGLLGPRRRRQLAARHRAVEAMLGGASFADVASTLVDAHGLDAAEASSSPSARSAAATETAPGLGRERVYLESLVRVRRHLEAHPHDDAILASGQVAVDAIDALRPFARVPDAPDSVDLQRDGDPVGAALVVVHDNPDEVLRRRALGEYSGAM